MVTRTGGKKAASGIDAARALPLPAGRCAGDPAPLAGALVAALEETLRAARRLLAALEADGGSCPATAAGLPGRPAARGRAGESPMGPNGGSAAPTLCAAGALDLSPREAEVLGLLAAGRTDREIAAALCLSVRTVSNHVARIRARTGTENRTALAAFALRHGLA